MRVPLIPMRVPTHPQRLVVFLADSIFDRVGIRHFNFFSNEVCPKRTKFHNLYLLYFLTLYEKKYHSEKKDILGNNGGRKKER